jgi:tetratricopeptide (TPR) repeat protein
MGVDPRHDHSFRIPRPDLSTRFAVPDACTGCHTDRQPAWAAEALQQWYGRLRTDRSTWTEAFAGARAGRADAAAKLVAIASDAELPDIVRATALHELPRPLDATTAPPVLTALRAEDPLLRWTATEMLAEENLELRSPLPTLLDDPVRAVRMAAARGLVAVDPSALSEQQLAAMQRGLAEFVAAQRVNADRPESRLNLGNLRLEQGDFAAAEREFRAAIRLHPQFVPGHVNLADLHRARDDEAACERVLRDALEIAPAHAELSHALGLCLVRQRRLDEALAALGEAAAAAPAHARYAYVHAVALESVGRLDDAVDALKSANERRPDDPALLEPLVEYQARNGDGDGARKRAAEYAAKWPLHECVRRWRQGLLR